MDNILSDKVEVAEIEVKKIKRRRSSKVVVLEGKKEALENIWRHRKKILNGWAVEKTAKQIKIKNAFIEKGQLILKPQSRGAADTLAYNLKKIKSFLLVSVVNNGELQKRKIPLKLKVENNKN